MAIVLLVFKSGIVISRQKLMYEAAQVFVCVCVSACVFLRCRLHIKADLIGFDIPGTIIG